MGCLKEIKLILLLVSFYFAHRINLLVLSTSSATYSVSHLEMVLYSSFLLFFVLFRFTLIEMVFCHDLFSPVVRATFNAVRG